MPKSIDNGKIAEILAYGFSGKRPYHFSNKYLRPCATKIEKGRIKKTTASGLKPVIIKQKISKIVAMEFREAKNPLVVEKSPIKANAKMGRLISGDKNTLSTVLCHEKTGARPEAILLKKSPIWKFSLNKSSMIVAG